MGLESNQEDLIMKAIRVLAGCAFAICLALPAFAATDFHVRVNLGNAPPPPVVYVRHAPRTVWLPEQQVSVVSDPDFDNDTFQVGGYWYVHRDNYWYRGRSWRGPFTVVDERYVPTRIAEVPANRWHGDRWMGPYNSAGYERRYYDNDAYRSNDRWRDRYGRWHSTGRRDMRGWRDADGNWHQNNGWRDRDGQWHSDDDNR